MGWFTIGGVLSLLVLLWAFWEPIMKITKSWLETVKAYREAKEAKARMQKTESELKQMNQEERHLTLWVEAKEKQRQERAKHPSNITWNEAWYRKEFERLTEVELQSFIFWLKKGSKL